MTLLKLKRFAQVTLPSNLRKKFDLAEGDFLEAEAVEEGILLKPVTVVERKKAWKQVFESMEDVHNCQPDSIQDISRQEKEIAGMVKTFRKRHA